MILLPRINIRCVLNFVLCCILLLVVIELSVWVLDEGDSCFYKKDSKDHRLAIIIPYRNRSIELRQLVPYLHQFLLQQNVQHSFYVVIQSDHLRFNRGALLNAGFIESFRIEQDRSSDSQILFSLRNPTKKQICFPPTDYVALHDVDLLPVDKEIHYTWPGDRGPYHPIPAPFHPRYYWYANYFGGILIITRDQYMRVNGMSNSFWGWGAEDDEFRRRVIRAGYVISTATNLSLGRNAFRSVHNEKEHIRDTFSYYDPRVRKLILSAHGGLSSVNYSVINRELVYIDEVPIIRINVLLKCNMPIDLCDSSVSKLYKIK